MVIVSPAFCGASDLAMRLIYYHVTTPTWTAGCRAFTLNKTHPSDLRPEIILFFVAQIVTVICLTISVSFLSSDVEDENGNDAVFIFGIIISTKASRDNGRILFICQNEIKLLYNRFSESCMN